MNGFLISNTKFEPPPDGWVQVLSLGEFPNAEAGLVQVCDEKAFEAIVEDFKAQSRTDNWPGMLVDYDHFSHQKDKPSGAAGWADSVERRGDGLWAHVRFSESGERAVRGGEYRLLSPVLTGFVEVEGQRKRPMKLLRLALTNDPNIQGMQPVSNRNSADNTTKRQENTMDYKEKLAELLGLNRDAGDADIEKAVEDVKTEAANRAKAAEEEEAANRAAEEAAKAAKEKDEEDEDEDEARNRSEPLLKRIAELEREVAEVHASRYDPMFDDPKAKAALRELCVLNRGAVDAVIAAIKPKSATTTPETKPVLQPLFNRRVQRLPDASKPADAVEAGAQSEAVKVRLEAQKILAANRAGGMTYSQAWGLAEKTIKAKVAEAAVNGE